MAIHLHFGGHQRGDQMCALEKAPQCTGITATWCPIHGNCTCPATKNTYGDIDRLALDGPGCPLHAHDSTHAEAQS